MIKAARRISMLAVSTFVALGVAASVAWACGTSQSKIDCTCRGEQVRPGAGLGAAESGPKPASAAPRPTAAVPASPATVPVAQAPAAAETQSAASRGPARSRTPQRTVARNRGVQHARSGARATPRAETRATSGSDPAQSVASAGSAERLLAVSTGSGSSLHPRGRSARPGARAHAKHGASSGGRSSAKASAHSKQSPATARRSEPAGSASSLGSQLAFGAGLFGLGLVALFSGLAVTEARRPGTVLRRRRRP